MPYNEGKEEILTNKSVNLEFRACIFILHLACICKEKLDQWIYQHKYKNKKGKLKQFRLDSSLCEPLSF